MIGRTELQEAVAGFEDALLGADPVEALGRLAVAGGAEGATLVRLDKTRHTVTVAGSASLADVVAGYLAGKAPPDPRPARVRLHRLAGFRLDQDDFTAAELGTDPFYQEWLRPNGCVWNAVATLHDDAAGTLCLSFKRGQRAGRFGNEERRPLDDLLPRLRHAAALARILADRFDDRTDAASLHLAHGGRVLALFDRAGLLEASGLRIRNERLVAPVRIQQGALDAAVVDACRPGAAGVSLLLQSEGGRGACVLLRLVPARSVMRTLISGIAAVVLVQPVRRRGLPDADLVGTLAAFGLTAAEGRVAALIACGWAPPAIARELGVTHETVRSHLKQILNKTGTGKQTEFVSLVWRLMR